jgi:hypothetical protein
MKKLSIAFLLTFALGGIIAHGAVIPVNSGQVLQSAIDSASSGDELVLAGGVYNTAEITNKSLSFRSISGTAQIHSFKFSGANQLCIVKDIRVTNDFESNESQVRFYNCEVSGDVNATNSIVELIQTSVAGNATFSGNGFNGGPSKTFLFRCTINQKLTCETAKSKIEYSLIRYSQIAGHSEITGNEFKGRSLTGIGIDVEGTATNVFIRNNRIHDFSKQDSGNVVDAYIGIRVRDSARAEITNNLIYKIQDIGWQGNENRIGMGIFVVSTSATKVAGNIFWDIAANQLPSGQIGNAMIYASNNNVTVTNNVFWRKDTSSSSNTSNYVRGGAVNTDPIIGDPKFTDLANGDFTLASDSPAKNAGPPASSYNDRDGSRNDVGRYGGHNFIPNGRTTDKPIVLSLDVAPIFVPVGGKVTIESTGATVK